VTGLLRDYDRLLLEADHAPPFVWIRTRPARPGRWLDPWRLPRTTLLLRYFVRAHVRHGVESLRRRLSAERALGDSSPGLERDHEAVVRYEQALPPTHARVIVVALAAGVFVLGRLALQFAGTALSSVPAFTHVQRGELLAHESEAHQPIALRGEAQTLMRRLGDSLTEGVPSPAKVMDVLLSARLEDIAVVMVSTAFALYIALRPCIPAFRLKRMLFNVGADSEALRMTTARWSVPRRTGIYTSEERVFGWLGTRPPREPPFDLIVSALLCAVPLGIGVYLLTRARLEPAWVGWVVYDWTLVIALLLVSVACLRVAWLFSTWRSRDRADVPLRPPYDLRLSDGRYVAVRDPFATGLIIFLVPQSFLVWLAVVVLDLKAIFRARGRRPGQIRIGATTTPGTRWVVGLALAPAAGWFLYQLPIAPLTALVPSDLIAAWPPGSWWPWWLGQAVLVLTTPTVAAYGQHTLNRLLTGVGTPVQEGPEPSPPETSPASVVASLPTSGSATTSA
jgi:hypothetical protein